jgi:hypothetical protein
LSWRIGLRGSGPSDVWAVGANGTIVPAAAIAGRVRDVEKETSMGFDGKGSEHELEDDIPCPKCKQKGKVYYLGSDVLHGNPYTPASDTEVDHHYRCEGCMHEWSKSV